MSLNSKAQVAVCKEFFYTKLNANTCDVHLVVSDIDEGSYDYTSIHLSNDYFNETGIFEVDLIVTKNLNSTVCTSNVVIEDKNAPLIVSPTNFTVTLTSNQPLYITTDLIPIYTEDCDSDVTLEFDPEFIDCKSNESQVLIIRAQDSSGNKSSTVTDLNIKVKYDFDFDLICIDTLIKPMQIGKKATLHPSEFILSPFQLCEDDYIFDVLVNGHNRSSKQIAYTDKDSSIVVFITDVFQNQRDSSIVQIVESPCQNTAFYICDTQSACDPEGDCSVGHTTTDNIEWPCDFNGYVSIETILDPSPTNLAKANISSQFIEPIIIGDSCGFVNVSYVDQLITTGTPPLITLLKVRRYWTVFNWYDGKPYHFQQTLLLYNKAYESCTVCDFLPWNTPVGDCASGHTYSDAVEWPADVTIDGAFADVESLEKNPLVDPRDVRPTLVNSCKNLELTYQDQAINTQGNDWTILRKWKIVNKNDLSVVNYTQIINAHNVPTASKIIQFRLPDENILTGVKVDGIEVNEDGLINLDTVPIQNGHIFKDDYFATAVDINDVVYMRELILGIQPYWENFRQLAGDISGGGGLSTLDLIYVQRYLLGIDSTGIYKNHPRMWEFYIKTNDFDEIEPYSSIDSLDYKPYEFMTVYGLKIGDVDYSYTIPYDSIRIERFYTEDQILNKGQKYQVVFENSNDLKFKALNFRIMKNNFLVMTNWECTVMSSVYMHETTESYNFYFLLEDIGSDVYLAKGTNVFKFEFVALQNDVLSKALQFAGPHKDRLSKGGNNPSFGMDFGFSNVIPVETVDFTREHHIKVFPNPTYDDIHIASDRQMRTINLYGIDGTMIKRWIPENENFAEKIDIRDVPSGMYLLEIMYLSGEKQVTHIHKL